MRRPHAGTQLAAHADGQKGIEVTALPEESGPERSGSLIHAAWRMIADNTIEKEGAVYLAA